MDTVTSWYMAKGPPFVGTVYNSMVQFGSNAKRPIPPTLLEPQDQSVIIRGSPQPDIRVNKIRCQRNRYFPIVTNLWPAR